jgi:hypothetical protein
MRKVQPLQTCSPDLPGSSSISTLDGVAVASIGPCCTSLFYCSYHSYRSYRNLWASQSCTLTAMSRELAR